MIDLYTVPTFAEAQVGSRRASLFAVTLLAGAALAGAVRLSASDPAAATGRCGAARPTATWSRR